MFLLLSVKESRHRKAVAIITLRCVSLAMASVCVVINIHVFSHAPM